jgi:hypothetical protein
MDGEGSRVSHQGWAKGDPSVCQREALDHFQKALELIPTGENMITF